MACNKLTNITRQLRIIAVVLFFFTACKESKVEDEKVSAPESKQIVGKVVDKSGVEDPVTIVAGNPSRFYAKQLNKRVIHENSVISNPPVKLNVISTNIKYPGREGVPLPKVIPAKIKSVIAYPPARVTAKDAYVRDKNPYNFSSIAKLQGLRHDQIRSITEDSTGNLWLGTDDGLTKFDGRYLYHYTKDQGLTNSLILTVKYDSKGNIWAGTFRGGAVMFDGREFHMFTTEEGLPSDIVNWIEEDNSGNIWFATGGGIVKYDGKNLTVYTQENGLCDNDTRYLITDKYGKLWVSSNLGGISCFNGESFTNYTKEEGLPQNEVTSLYEDTRGDIWMGLSTMGILKYDGYFFFHYSKQSGLTDGGVRSILEDYKGNIWIGSTTSGLFKFDGKRFTNYNLNEGLGSDYVRCLHEDRSGNLWIGTRTAGLVRYKGDVFTHLTADDGLSNSRVMSIHRALNGSVWLGTFGGYVTIIDNPKDINGGGTLSLFGPDQGLTSSRVYSLFEEENGNMWMGTDGGGVVIYDGTYTYTYTTKEGLCDNTIRDIARGNNGDIWIGTYGGGASKYDGKSFTNFSVKSGLSGNNIMAIYTDRNGLVWLGSDGGGVSTYNGSEFTHYTTKEGFFSNIVNSITEDKDGNIWFGTGGEGLVRFDGKYFTRYGVKEGLNNDYVMSILIDSSGVIWAGSRYGINKITKDSSLSGYKIRSYNYEDGFIGMGCNLGSIEDLPDGNILTGTNDRLTRFHGDKEIQKSAPFTLHLTNLMIFNEEIPWTYIFTNRDSIFQLNNGLKLKNINLSDISKWNNIPLDLELPHKLNYITFKYIAVAQDEIDKVRYEYKLEGLDLNWNKTSAITEIPYVNLSPGNYTFKVRAQSSEGVLSNEVSYKFRIKPPWWQTVWFYLILSIGAITIIYLFIKNRERALRVDKELLQKKVEEQTEELLLKNNELEVLNEEKDKLFSIIAHDLRGPFSSFLGLTQIMSEDLTSFTQEEIKSFADNMNKSAKNLYDLLENLLHWSRMQRQAIPFNPTEIALRNSIIDCLGWVLDSAKKKGVNFTVDIPETMKVEADESMIQTVIRNIASNSVKFTPKGGDINLTAELISDNEIEIRIKDNGIGMDKEIQGNIFKVGNKGGRSGTEGEPSTGLGLMICKDLVDQHKGTIIVESAPMAGSQFIIRMPVKQR